MESYILTRVDDSASEAWLCNYDDDLNCICEKVISITDAKKYPYELMMDSGFVEI